MLVFYIAQPLSKCILWSLCLCWMPMKSVCTVLFTFEYLRLHFIYKSEIFWDNKSPVILSLYFYSGPEAVFLVVCDLPMNELWATQTGLWIYLYGSRSLTARSQKGRTQLKTRPQVNFTTETKIASLPYSGIIYINWATFTLAKFFAESFAPPPHCLPCPSRRRDTDIYDFNCVALTKVNKASRCEGGGGVVLVSHIDF